jgi:hypothetical protein
VKNKLEEYDITYNFAFGHPPPKVSFEAAQTCQQQSHVAAALSTRYGQSRLFSVTKGKSRAGGHLCDAGELQGDLRWGGKNYQQRGLHNGVSATEGAIQKVR